MTFIDRLKLVNKEILAVNEDSFNEFTKLFTDNNLKDERLEHYTKYKDLMGKSSLAEAKHELLRNIFGDYVRTSLKQANSYAIDRNDEEAVKLVSQIEKLRNIFKDHDIVDYKEFIIESEPNINDAEVELLFLKPLLNKSELQTLTDAFIKALGKKSEVDSFEDFQQKFFTHPLISCLDAYKDSDKIKDAIDNGTIELFNYKNLVKLMIDIREKVNAEEYQGFITFMIKEDLTKGFGNILKSRNYEPKYFKDVLNSIALGNNLNNDEVESLIKEIRTNHTKNLRVEKGELKMVNSSVHSLNDYGFPVTEKGFNFFFHGHATENHGERQADQQANTGLNLDYDNKFEKNLGLTVTKLTVLKNSHHRDFLRREELDRTLNITKTEEVLISNLVFDASYFSRLATKVEKDAEVGKSVINELKNSHILETNHLIIKSEIERSQKIILNSIGKSDFELICEKKNAYMNVFMKNETFVSDVLTTASTNNYLVNELLGSPIVNFVKHCLYIEREAGIKLFTNDEINFVEKIMKLENRNVSLADEKRPIKDLLKYRASGELADINVESFNYLKVMSESDKEKKEVDVTHKKVEHTKVLKSVHLSDALYFLEKNPLGGKEITKAQRTRAAKSLFKNIQDSADDLLLYRSDKVEQMTTAISLIGDRLLAGKEFNFAKSDWSQSNYADEYKTLAFLLKDKDKKEEQVLNDRLILRSLIEVAELSGGSLKCHNVKDLKSKLKM